MTETTLPSPEPAHVHPAVRLLAWGCMVVLGQTLEGGALVFAVGVALGAGYLLARGHLLRLLRRARFLLLSIGLLFVCGTPGEALLPWLGALSPTAEGLILGVVHGGRLLLVLALLALLLEFTSAETLVAGLYGLLKPFARLPRERVALRLMLVLQYAEEQKAQGRRRPWREWLVWLECQDAAAPMETVYLHVAPLAGLDFIVLAILTLLLAAFFIY